MSSIKLTLDVSKFNKVKIVDRKYKDRSQREVTAKEYKVEVVPLKVPKVISSGEKDGKKWVLKKTHFVVEAMTKEEKARGEQQNFVGDGFEFENSEEPVIDVGVEDDINPDNIPF